MSKNDRMVRSLIIVMLAFAASAVLYFWSSFDAGTWGPGIQIAHANSTGANFAGAAANQGAGWNNPGNTSGTDDGVCADIDANSRRVQLTSYGFSVPAGATITGISVEAKSGHSVGGGLKATLVKAGVAVGTLKDYTPATTATCAGTTFSTIGADGDLWGTTWTRADVNDTNFGVEIRSGTDTGTRLLDAARITVYYKFLLLLPLIIR